MVFVPPRPPLTWIRDTLDAILAIQAALRGDIPLFTKAQSAEERDALVYHGSLIVWDRDSLEISRWNDSVSWSFSRIFHSMLLYREKTEIGDKPWAYTGDVDTALYYDVFSAHVRHHLYKPAGLMKRAISVRVQGRRYHVINYVEPFSLLPGEYPFNARPLSRLARVSDIPLFARHKYDIHSDLLCNIKRCPPLTRALIFPADPTRPVDPQNPPTTPAPTLVFVGNHNATQDTQQQMLDAAIDYWARRLRVALHSIEVVPQPLTSRRRRQRGAAGSRATEKRGIKGNSDRASSVPHTTPPPQSDPSLSPYSNHPSYHDRHTGASSSSLRAPRNLSQSDNRYNPYKHRSRSNARSSASGAATVLHAPPQYESNFTRGLPPACDASASGSQYHVAQTPHRNASSHSWQTPLTPTIDTTPPSQSYFHYLDLSDPAFIGAPSSFDTFKFPSRAPFSFDYHYQQATRLDPQVLHAPAPTHGYDPSDYDYAHTMSAQQNSASSWASYQQAPQISYA